MTLEQLKLLTTYGKARQPLCIRQVITLFLLAEHGPHKLRHLAKLLECTPAGAGRATERLNAERLVTRTRGQDDARDVFIGLTGKGRELVKQLDS